MNHSRMRQLGWVAAFAVGGGLLASASDHREAPLIREDLTADLADLYLFPSPSDSSKVVLALTVNGFTAPSENTTFGFSPEAVYSFAIDNTGDAIEDITLDFKFPKVQGPPIFWTRFTGQPSSMGMVTRSTLEPTANPAIINSGPAGSSIFAGQVDDPFFFDVVGFNRVLGGTGTFSGSDGFAGYNVSAIVVEVPLSYLNGGGDMPLQVWAKTSRRRVKLHINQLGQVESNRGDFRQVDRVGNPALNTALIPANLKDFFNVSEPSNDGNAFAGAIVASLQSLGTSMDNINILASVAVPDTLKYDSTQPAGYPNGRGLADDVIDTLFFFIFNQAGVTDSVDANDKSFNNTFPYLATPWQP